MKVLQSFLMLLLYSFSVNAQCTSAMINPKLFDLKLYNSFFNLAVINYENIPCDSLKIMSSDLSIVKSNCCKFYLKPKPFISNATAFVFNGSNVVDSIIFQINSDVPSFSIINTTKTLYQNDRNYFDSLLVIIPEELNYEINKKLRFKIESFTVELKRRDFVFYSEIVTGNKFTLFFRKAMERVQPGDEIIINSIVIKSDDSSIYSVPRKIFRIR
ncbi:MAG: hypothetical protein EOO43_22535 [Flavobacterium sp.]|nr:MAG: hypothetical protein EOO43_22535 [Flavobacterium sp.]